MLVCEPCARPLSVEPSVLLKLLELKDLVLPGRIVLVQLVLTQLELLLPELGFVLVHLELLVQLELLVLEVVLLLELALVVSLAVPIAV